MTPTNTRFAQSVRTAAANLALLVKRAGAPTAIPVRVAHSVPSLLHTGVDRGPIPRHIRALRNFDRS